jgi:hypothetical protein
MPKQVLNNAGTTVYYHDGSSFVEFTPCSGWTGRFTIKTSPYVSNDTGGGTGRTAGATDAVGTINWRPNKASGPPELLDGDDILLQLWLTDDIDDGYWQGVAKFSEFNIDTTPQDDGGDSQKAPISWEANGAWQAFNLSAEGASSSA